MNASVNRSFFFFVSLALLLGARGLPGADLPLSPAKEQARDIYKELIEINTTSSAGSTTRAAEAMARRLRAAGLPAADLSVLGPEPNKGNLVARLRGRGTRKPLLLLAHLDVVEARREDWSTDPFVLLEKDGYFYGRGTTDDKAMAAIWVSNLIRYAREGYRPDRDLIVALTADEEGGDANGVEWLLKAHRELVDAAYCLNEGGGGQIKDGLRLANTVQASEKVYESFWLEVKDRGGHSSLPTAENAIYRLSTGLSRLAAFHFPARLNEVTRAFFSRQSAIATGPEAADMKAILADPPDPQAISRLSERPYFNALLRTTCIPTRLEAGHADNALPQTARALVNCRMLPDETPSEVEQTLVRVLADEKITLMPLAPPRPSPPSPLAPEVLGPIERITEALWPGVPVMPVMSTGATDGLHLRRAGIPTYGVDGLFEDISDVRAHGKDERLKASSFYEGQEFLYRLVKSLSSTERP
jgi:acetylornithine deacetylase/succinyl-diaminopimelate desuccinylase-like protein